VADLLWRRALGEAAASGARSSAVGPAAVPLTLAAATVALWGALRL